MEKPDPKSQIHHKECGKLLCQFNENKPNQFIHLFSFRDTQQLGAECHGYEQHGRLQTGMNALGIVTPTASC